MRALGNSTAVNERLSWTSGSWKCGERGEQQGDYFESRSDGGQGGRGYAPRLSAARCDGGKHSEHRRRQSEEERDLGVGRRYPMKVSREICLKEREEVFVFHPNTKAFRSKNRSKLIVAYQGSRCTLRKRETYPLGAPGPATLGRHSNPAIGRNRCAVDAHSTGRH